MLHRFGIRTFDDLQKSDSSLLAITCQDWFRLLDREKVRGSENEIADAPVWAQVKEAFEYYFSKSFNAPRSESDLRSYRPPHESPNTERLFQQAVGCISSAVAVVKEKISDARQLEKCVWDWFSSVSDVVLGKVIERQVKNEIVRNHFQGPKRGYDCLQEVQLALSPVGFPEFWQYEGSGWEEDGN